MDEVQRGFGSFAAQTTFAGLYPDYYEESADTFTFLLGIEEKIHELVRATIEGASPPRLHVQPLGEVGVLDLVHVGATASCRLLRGASILGTAEHYGDDCRRSRRSSACTADDAGCVFTVMRPANARKVKARSRAPSSKGFLGGRSRRRLRPGEYRGTWEGILSAASFRT